MSRPESPRSIAQLVRRGYRRLRPQPRGHGKVTVERGPGYVQYSGPQAAVVQAELEPDRRTGIYLRGACDLPSLFGSVPLFRDEVRGTVCLYKAPGKIDSARADLLLQTLQDLPASQTAETVRRLKLHPKYFSGDLFEPTFRVVAMPQLGEVPKTVVVLSVAPNVIRTVYRHKEQGFLVDPGGSWLNNRVRETLADRETIEWFAERFERIGQFTVEQFRETFSALVREVNARTGAAVAVTNVLTVEPSDRTHNFQLRPRPQGLRRRQFNLALVDLSRELGFHIIDVDRALKRTGVDPALDFAHFEGHSYGAVAKAAHRVFRELDVL
jgi:hypothetical protein